MLDIRNLSNNSSIIRDNILNYVGTTINNFINFNVNKDIITEITKLINDQYTKYNVL